MSLFRKGGHMAKKFYAVKKGKITGIFQSWDECKKQVDGFSGAEYKSFKTYEEAESYLKDSMDNSANDSTDILDAEIYVDGSYNDSTKEFSYGMIVLREGKEYKFADKFNDATLSEMHNVAGEIKGAEAAMQYALKNSLKNIALYHDYEGIAKWCLGQWQAKKEGTKAYKAFYDEIKQQVNIKFIKVKGHSNNKFNDIADELAKQALDLCEKKHDIEEKIIIPTVKEAEQVSSSSKSMYIVRDSKKLEKLLNDVVKSIWSDASGGRIKEMKNQKRYTFIVNGVEASLDIYQRNDGQTTLCSIGKNIKYSDKLKEEIELRGYKATTEQKSFSMFIGDEWVQKTIEFLKELCNGNIEEHDDVEHKRYVFISEIGDKLTLILHSNNRLVVQGKPLYLYNEFLSFVSYSPKVEMNDIIQATNTFVETNTDIDNARSKLAEMMPTAYAGNVDDVIWKLFTPSISLMDTEKVFEDYSCFAFPALRALEGYLKYLLDLKGIVIDEQHNFGTVFNKDPEDDEKRIVISSMATRIGDAEFLKALEEIYNYFKRNRHVLFHVDQILINTKVIENRQEAITIISEVSELIENTYKKIGN